MAKITTMLCDRCQRHCNLYAETEYTIRQQAWRWWKSDRWDLCADCYESLIQWKEAGAPSTSPEKREALEDSKLMQALRDYGQHQAAIPELGVEGCDYDPEQGIPCTCGLAAILNPEGPDANTENK